MTSFNYNENFLRFVTEAHVVYLALKLLDMDDVDAISDYADVTTQDDIMASFMTLCEQIVEIVWLMPPMTNVTSVVDSDVNDSFITDNWCICEQGTCT